MERLLGRIDAQPLNFAGLALPRADAEDVAGADDQRPDGKRAPAVAAQLQLDRLLLAGAKVERPRRRSLHAHLRREKEEQLETVDAVGRGQFDFRRDLVPFEHALAIERQLD